MEKHFIPSVFDRHIDIYKPVRIDPHSCQGVVIGFEEVLYKAIVFDKTLMYGMKLAFLAEGELHIIIGAVI